jgi:uncharacterized membrane protein (UPF0127 family)
MVVGPAGCNEVKPVQPYEVTINGRTWQVEVAMTERERYRGLSGRSLAENAGMLFIYPDAAERQFCMRGCAKDLDIAFIAADRTIVNTTTMKAEPDRAGRVAYPSSGPAQWVLEVAAGDLLAAGVKPGQVVQFSPNIPLAAKAEPGP